MKTTRYLALLGVLYLAIVSAWAAVPLTQLVDEHAPLVVSFHDVPSLMKNWKQSPWAKTWNDEQVKKFLAPLRAQMKVDEWDENTKRETGCTVDELFALATGDAVIVVQNLDAIDKLQTPEDLPVLIAIELGENMDKLGKIIADGTKKEGEPPVVTETFSGVTVYTRPFNANSKEKETITWAFVDGVGLFSWSKVSILGAIDALKKGGVNNSFGQSERFVRARQQIGETQVMVFANLQAIVPAIRKAVAAHSGEGEQKSQIDHGPLLDALGLDALEALYFGVNIGETATAMNGGITYTDMRGLMKMLAYRDGPTVQPAFVSPKWISVSSSQYSVRDAYSALEDILEAFNPMISGAFQGQVKAYNKQLGIDLKRDLIGSLGDTLITATAMPTGATAEAPAPLTEYQQLYAISLRNAPAFTSAIEALKRLMGQDPDTFFKKREYLGAVIHTYAPPGSAAADDRHTVSYAITPQYVFIGVGSPAIIETALQGIDGKQPSLWDKPEVKAALADVPPNACAIQFQDTGAMIASLIETAARAAAAKEASAAPAEDGGDAEKAPAKQSPPFDSSARPDPEAIAKYWGHSVGYGYRDSHGIYFHSQLNYAQ